jgi:ribose 5-phosphate isomerase B
MHNDANVLCFGARVVGEGLALDIVDAYLDAEYLGERHQKRVDMLTAIEDSEAAR